MIFRELGRSGVRVSVAGLGGFQFGDPCGAAATAEIVDRAVEHGINFIDTADVYSAGLSESHLGRAIKSHRESLIVATKTGWIGEPGWEPGGGGASRRRLIRSLDASLARLQLDHVDLFYVHRWDPVTPLEETLRTIDDLVRAGKIRYFGVSNYTGWQIAEAVATCEHAGYVPPVVVQSRYNLLWRAVEPEVVPACARYGISVIAHTALAEGLLTGKYRGEVEPPPGARGHKNDRWRDMWLHERNLGLVDRYSAWAQARGRTLAELALAWCASRDQVASVLFGATSVEQLDKNVAGFEWQLEEDDLAQLEALG